MNAPEPAAVAPQIVMLRPHALHPHPKNPRKPEALTSKGVASLRRIIEQWGQKDPCLVRPIKAGPHAGEHEVVLGHRRRLIAEAREVLVPCVVEDLDDIQALAIMLSHQESPVAHDPFLESDAVADLLARPGWTVEFAANMLGKSVKWVAWRANLRNLTPRVRALYEQEKGGIGNWPVEFLEDLARCSAESQDELVASGVLPGVQSLRDLDRVLGDRFRELGKATWKLDDALLVPAAGSCASCPKQSCRQPGLFGDVALDPTSPGELAKATCPDAPCWAKKAAAHALAEIRKAREKHPDAILVRSQGDAGGERLPAGVKSAMHSRDVIPATKKTRGAVPAVDVTGSSVGAIHYVVPKAHVKAAEKAAAEKKAKPVDHKARVAASRAEVADRRRAHVSEGAAVAIANLNDLVPPPVVVVSDFVAAFGATPPTIVAALGDGSLRAVKRLSRLRPGDWAREVWPRTRDAFLDLVGHARHPGAGRSLIPAFLEEEKLLRWACEALKVDVAALERKAIAAIPDEPWWTDGAPASTKRFTHLATAGNSRTACGARGETATVAEDKVTCPSCRETAELDLEPITTCRVCGCSDLDACDGGCSWVALDLCSACIDAPARSRKSKPPAPAKKKAKRSPVGSGRR